MKRIIPLILFAAMLWSVSANAQYGPRPVAILGNPAATVGTEFYQTFDRALSPDSVYVLKGLYLVDSTYTLTIYPGTVILGDSASAGTLIIKRGAKIVAKGTKVTPIIFSSADPPGQRDPGDWGGVVLLGEAPVNKFEPLIEGGIIPATYGGNKPDDSTGVFAYIRIEYAGFRFQLNNEINGLTMGGVGRGTELHHIQVSYAFDDSYEWFGGTVDAKYLVAFGGTDDEFDSDFGYTGRLQYLFGLRDPEQFDPNGESRGFESDNDGSSTSTDEPYTNPIISNATLVGPARTDAAIFEIPPPATFDWSGVARRSSRLEYYNSATIGYPRGLSMRDVFTKEYAAANQTFQNVSIAAFAQGNDTSRWPANDPVPPGVDAWFFGAPGNIGVIRMPNTVGLTDMSNLNNPNPAPLLGSELDTSPVDYSMLDPTFFDVVDYRGAFVPALPMDQQWTCIWTNFSPQDTDYNPTITGIGDDTPAMALGLEQNHPNPFNPTTTIRFTLSEVTNVSLNVYDANGALVRTLADGTHASGPHSVTWDGRNDSGITVSTGVYFYQLQAGSSVQTRKMVLLK